MSYACFSLQQKEGKSFSDKFLNHEPAKIYNKNLYANLCSVLSLNQPHYIKTFALKHEVSPMQKKKTKTKQNLIVTRAKI